MLLAIVLKLYQDGLPGPFPLTSLNRYLDIAYAVLFLGAITTVVHSCALLCFVSTIFFSFFLTPVHDRHEHTRISKNRQYNLTVGES